MATLDILRHFYAIGRMGHGVGWHISRRADYTQKWGGFGAEQNHEENIGDQRCTSESSGQ